MESGGMKKHEAHPARNVQYIPGMATPQLDQFTHALFWKAVPWIILGGGGAMLIGGLLRWLERRAIRFGQDRRKKRAAQSAAPGR
jgi:hypothetical protein